MLWTLMAFMTLIHVTLTLVTFRALVTLTPMTLTRYEHWHVIRYVWHWHIWHLWHLSQVSHWLVWHRWLMRLTPTDMTLVIWALACYWICMTHMTYDTDLFNNYDSRDWHVRHWHLWHEQVGKLLNMIDFAWYHWLLREILNLFYKLRLFAFFRWQAPKRKRMTGKLYSSTCNRK